MAWNCHQHVPNQAHLVKSLLPTSTTTSLITSNHQISLHVVSNIEKLSTRWHHFVNPQRTSSPSFRTTTLIKSPFTRHDSVRLPKPYDRVETINPARTHKHTQDCRNSRFASSKQWRPTRNTCVSNFNRTHNPKRNDLYKQAKKEKKHAEYIVPTREIPTLFFHTTSSLNIRILVSAVLQTDLRAAVPLPRGAHIWQERKNVLDLR